MAHAVAVMINVQVDFHTGKNLYHWLRWWTQPGGATTRTWDRAIRWSGDL